MKIILHIGVHKTGTSALQAFLHRNAALLLEHGVFYKPTTSDWPNHNPLVAAFLPESVDDGLERLARTIEAADNNTLLISSEMLCGHSVDLERFLFGLEGHDLRVFAYIRHPADIVVSAFNELVRHRVSHWTRPLNEEPFAYDPSQMDVLRRWLKVPNITLAPYDRPQWAGGSIFNDFLGMIGVPCDGFDFSQTGGNESLPYPLIEALRNVNVASPSADQHRMLVELFRTIQCEPGEYPLTQRNVAKCVERMRLVLPIYRPHFRAGFDERYLLEPRHAHNDRWFSNLARTGGSLVRKATRLFPVYGAGSP
ncbi:hypothetical protein [Mesorhizobium sp.]|uniref:hypothetical protein n=1 Tax=Mesorhizobium sp. TaxID=1871066 RepID=UPI0025ED6AEE|nr:hypothetical protein [Mesorhizobium sp.]